MICPRCGAPNSPNDKFCAVCSSPLAPAGMGGPGMGGPGGFPPPPQPFGNPPPYQGGGFPGGPPPFDPNYPPPGMGQMGGPGMGPPGMGQMGGPGMGPPPGMGQMGGPGMGGPMGPPGFDQGFGAPPPPFPPAPGGFPPPADGADAFGQTAFAPQPAPGTPPQQPVPPTGAMSGFGNSERQASTTGAPKGRRSLAGFLVSFQDDTLGKFWPLYQGRNLIGRAETGQEVDVPIGHGTTSTNHATIEADSGRITLSDLGSTNGTFHNEEAIGFQGRRELKDGDKIRFGGFSVIVINVAARS